MGLSSKVHKNCTVCILCHLFESKLSMTMLRVLRTNNLFSMIMFLKCLQRVKCDRQLKLCLSTQESV